MSLYHAVILLDGVPEPSWLQHINAFHAALMCGKLMIKMQESASGVKLRAGKLNG
jgi:hypothetical protein